MRSYSYILCLWPGLHPLWLRGQWSGLLAAIAFGGGLNLALVCQLLGNEVLPSWCSYILWLAVGVVWVACAVGTFRSLPTTWQDGAAEAADEMDQGLFLQAQREYLKGHWYEAESLLKHLLGRRQRDVDAQLMLATLYRRTKRIDEAQRRLQKLVRMDGAEKWQFEIEQERHLLQRLKNSCTEADSSKQNSPVTKSS